MKRIVSIFGSLIIVLGLCSMSSSVYALTPHALDHYMILAHNGHGPGDGTGNGGDGPKDGTGNGPGSCTTSSNNGEGVFVIAHNGYGPGDGTGNDGDGPQDGTGYGPGPNNGKQQRGKR